MLNIKATFNVDKWKRKQKPEDTETQKKETKIKETTASQNYPKSVGKKLNVIMIWLLMLMETINRPQFI